MRGAGVCRFNRLVRGQAEESLKSTWLHLEKDKEPPKDLSLGYQGFTRWTGQQVVH